LCARSRAFSWERNGYAFHNADAPGLESALSRAIGLSYSYPQETGAAAKRDASRSFVGAAAQDCLTIYEHIRHE
jgi:hypothetical protein